MDKHARAENKWFLVSVAVAIAALYFVVTGLRSRNPTYEPFLALALLACSGACCAGLESNRRDLHDWNEKFSRNPGLLEAGLTLVGANYPTIEEDYIDLLFKDTEGTYVVVEFQGNRSVEASVAQIEPNVQWVRANLAGGNRVRAMVIVPDATLIRKFGPPRAEIPIEFVDLFDLKKKEQDNKAGI